MIGLWRKTSSKVSLDDLINAMDQDPGQALTVPTSWSQGRTVYGGLTAALIHHCMQQKIKQVAPNEARPLRYLNLSFIGPIQADQALTIEVEPLRSGRSATQFAARVIQQDQVCVMAQGCFGVARESIVHLTQQHQHAMPVPKKASFLPMVPKVVPKFLQHLELNLQHGRWPFMRGDLAELHGWMRFKQTPQRFSDSHLIALIDAWPCTVLQQLKKPVAASTMSWNLEFTQTASQPQPEDWLSYQASTSHAAHGYVFGDAKVWNQQGELLAVSRQTVGVFG